MTDKVVFDGETYVVLVNDGVVLIDAEGELYSAWKRWCATGTRDGLKYYEFFRTVAGDPIRAGKSLGAHFFITNNCVIRPYIGNYDLVIEGNLWPEPGEEIFTAATGTATVLALVERAADAYEIIVTGSDGGDGFTSSDRTTITETHDSLGVFTGSVIVAVTPPVVTGTLTTEQLLLLEELHAIQGLVTGSPLEISPQMRRVLGMIEQQITYDSPTTGTTYVTRTG